MTTPNEFGTTKGAHSSDLCLFLQIFLRGRQAGKFEGEIIPSLPPFILGSPLKIIREL
jgi:hypothetical protein